MLFLFRSAPEVEKRIHSKLFRKFWRSRGTKEPAYITVFCSFLGLSQSVPVTSYVKMIDIWMLFTMTVPFLEVVYHTNNEVFKQPDKQGDVVRVAPQQEYEEEATPTTNINKKLAMQLTHQLMLPIGSLIFSLIFWVVGLIQSFSSGKAPASTMSNCLNIDFD